MRNKFNRITNEISAGGNRGVSGVVSSAEARILGERFVGADFTVSQTSSSTYLLKSADGLKQVRGPSIKRGIDTSTGRPWSKTGRQVNFEQRTSPRGPFDNNVHLDVK